MDNKMEPIADMVKKHLKESQGTVPPGHSRTLTVRKCTECGAESNSIFFVGIDNVCENCRTKKNAERRIQSARTALPGIESSQIAQWQIACGIPPKYRTKTFDNFDRKLQPKAFALMSKYEPANGKSLVLYSPDGYGTGKTHLVASLVNRMIAEQTKAYIDSEGYVRKCASPSAYMVIEPDLLAWIRSTYNRDSKQTEDDIYRKLLSFELLIIDDVGKRVPKDLNFTQGVYYKIINERYNNDKPVILTVNLTPDELENHIGGACADRLREMCGRDGFIKMTGASYRKLD